MSLSHTHAHTYIVYCRWGVNVDTLKNKTNQCEVWGDSKIIHWALWQIDTISSRLVSFAHIVKAQKICAKWNKSTSTFVPFCADSFLVALWGEKTAKDKKRKQIYKRITALENSFTSFNTLLFSKNKINCFKWVLPWPQLPSSKKVM